MTGAWAGAGLWAGLVAGLWAGQAYGVFYLPGFGLAVPAPVAPGHPTSICDIGVNLLLRFTTVYSLHCFYGT